MKSIGFLITAVVVNLLLVSSLARAEDLIIESAANGKNSSQYREISGKWMDSRIPPTMAKSPAPGLSPPGVCGTRKCLFWGHDVVTTGPAAARFYPRFETPGRYHVYVTWPRAANATPVYYDISHANGTKSVPVTQNGWGAGNLPCNAGTWVSLGQYDFDRGEDQFVELRIGYDVDYLESRWYGQVYADAVRFTSEPLRDPGTPLDPEAPPAWPGREPPTVISTAPIEWQTTLDAAWAMARQKNLKLLLFSYSPEGAGAARFERNIFSNPNVQAAISSHYVPLRLNVVTDQATVHRLGLYRGNIVVIYDSSGKALSQIADVQTGEEFLTFLRALP